MHSSIDVIVIRPAFAKLLDSVLDCELVTCHVKVARHVNDAFAN